MHNHTLDFLRGLAIIGVVLFHIWPENFKSGYLGVDLFFVLSGFLIAKNLNKGISGVEFFKNRFIRLGPLYFLTILLILITCLILGLRWVDKFNAICSLLAISNICYYQKNEYFNLFDGNDPLGHLWSISLEIQFYIISYLLIKYSKNILFTVAFISLLTCTYRYYQESYNYYDTSTRLWEYLAGSIVFLNLSKKFSIKQVKFSGLISGFIFVIYISIFTLNFKQNILLSFGFIIFTALIISSFSANQLKFYLVEKISHISYASYLVHYPIIKFINHYYKNNLFASFFALIATFLFGYILTYIYNVLIKNYNNKFKLSIIISLIFIISIIYIVKKTEYNNFQNIQDIQSEIKKIQDLKCSDGNYYDCYQTKGDQHDYLIVGDSHAMAIAVGSLLNYSDKKSSFKVISRGGCLPVVKYSFWNGNPDNKPRECEKFYDIVKNEIKGSYKYIIFANYNSLFTNKWKTYENHLYDNKKLINNNELISKITEQYIEVFKGIKKSGKTPIFILDVPEFDVNLINCKVDESLCKSPRVNVEISRSEDIKLKNTLSAEYNFKTISLLDLLCDNQNCYSYKDNEWRYSDGNHLNGNWGGKAFDFIINNVNK